MSWSPTRWIALGVGVVIVAVAGAFATQLGDDPTVNEPSRLLGQDAPDVSLRAFDGSDDVSLESLEGRAVIVNFWNSWCIPCREEEPLLKEFHAAHADDPDVVLLGILRDDDLDSAREYAQQHGLDWTLVDDPGGEAALAFGTRGQPETFAISTDGVIVGSQLGPVRSRADLETLLAAAR